ncbi:hypothetical protein EIP91_002598 [Steccherinum ochraceum]|uniref:Uncharacterized protein n=1 Tax=Steccherinum ochraceum TaxID=92696 RepID=A0A4R0S0M5_9APHY|nr:hypothetical protein EIP91_002598 [Steccherinum ochraceum]
MSSAVHPIGWEGIYKRGLCPGGQCARELDSGIAGDLFAREHLEVLARSSQDDASGAVDLSAVDLTTIQNQKYRYQPVEFFRKRSPDRMENRADSGALELTGGIFNNRYQKDRPVE